ncbi:hypothetical protein MKEN_01225200 [Mycena kentingensis (nom. inval.)]|nr:hypothetical protein MKEN_01225200 [Mycena kentingensis (nom. inval.)]
MHSSFRPNDSATHNADNLPRSAGPRKLSGACVHCKSLKVRCEWLPSAKICKRCDAGNFECLPRTRKKRKPAPTHEDLQEKAHQQDRKIEALLVQWDQLQMSSKMARIMGGDKPQNGSPELAAISYFSRGRGAASVPPIVTGCGLYPTDILELFNIYFEHVNPHFCLLDPGLHADPSQLIWSSPFLFTIICATAARIKDVKLCRRARAFARDAAGTALTDGTIGVDICQAYLIFSVYAPTERKWIEDRSWLFMGVAVRMAMQLQLNQPPHVAYTERERLNRTRTWLCCYCVDAFHSIQFGKVPMLSLDDYMARSSRDWYRSSSLNGPFDVYLSGCVQLLARMIEWKENQCTGQQNKHGFVAFTLRAQETITKEMDYWNAILERTLDKNVPSIHNYRAGHLRMNSAYLRLVILASGFQCAQKHFSLDTTHNREILQLSASAAREVIQIAIDSSFPYPYLRYAMDSHFLFISFAAAFLVNLLRPPLRPLLPSPTHCSIVRLVSQLVAVLGSPQIAMCQRHAPALHSRFLVKLLREHGGSLLEEYDAGAAYGEWPWPSPDINTARDISPIPSDSSNGSDEVDDLVSSRQAYGASGLDTGVVGTGMGMEFSLNQYLQAVFDGTSGQQDCGGVEWPQMPSNSNVNQYY